MKRTYRRVNFLLPADLADALYEYVPPRRRGVFVSEAVARELGRRRLLDAVRDSAGAWQDTDHPETMTGPQVERWIARSRRDRGWDRAKAR
jgi:hypothetical protein